MLFCNKMRIYYGTEDVHIDITVDVYEKCMGKNNKGNLVLFIPKGDLYRKELFTDVAPGIPKTIFVYKDNILVDTIDRFSTREILLYTSIPLTENTRDNLLNNIHEQIITDNKNENLQEQKLLVQFINKKCKILSLGCEYSLLMSFLITKDTDLICIEPDTEKFSQYYNNRDLNNRHYPIINSDLDRSSIEEICKQHSYNTVVISHNKYVDALANVPLHETTMVIILTPHINENSLHAYTKLYKNEQFSVWQRDHINNV